MGQVTREPPQEYRCKNGGGTKRTDSRKPEGQI